MDNQLLPRVPAMDSQPVTIRQSLWQYLVALTLVFSGFAIAGVLAEIIAPERPLVYGLCLCPSLIPFMLWLGYCGVATYDRWTFTSILLLMIGITFAREIAPAQWKNNLIFMVLGFALLQWLIESAIAVIKRRLGDSLSEAKPADT